MSRDGYERWDGRRDDAPDGYEHRGGRRGRRAARADEHWVPDSEADSYQDQGAGYADGGYPDPGYSERGSPDPGYGDPGYGDADRGSGYGGSGYPEAGYGSGYPGSGYPEPGHSDPGYAGRGYQDQPDGYGQSGGYGRPAGYPDGGYPGRGYGSSGEHRAPPYGGTGPQDGYRDATYPPGGYRDGSSRDPLGAPDPYGPGPDGYDAATLGGGGRSSGPYGVPDGYGGRAGYGEQDSYGGPAGYGTGDPYAGRGSGGAGPAGAQYGGGYDDRDFRSAAGAEAREQYLEREPDLGRAADRGGRHGWRDSVDDTGLRRPRSGDPEDDFDPDSARHNGFFRGFGAPDDEVGHRPPRKRRSRAGIAALLILIIFVGGIVGGGAYAYKWYAKRHADWTGSNGKGSVVVKVMPGEIACSSALENVLVSDGIVASGAAFCNAAKANGSGAQLEPGYFTLHKHMGAALAWALIINPKSRVQTTVAVPDGLRASKVIALLAAKTGIPLSKFEAALKDTSALGLPSWAKGNPEGFLWPATYNLQPGFSASSILQMLVKQATSEYASINLQAKAKAAQFTEYQVIIEASLLEAEVPPQYYTRVAKVIDNRLNQVPQWNLGLDSTVAYALNKYVYNLTQSDLNVNSPYNTTKHPGLPPAPIDSPDLAAIQAVLHPATTGALYFVTVNKQGLTEFTSDPNQFQAWANLAKKNGI
jgi:UPF0755 protein